ncbi:flagellar basal body rod C-terminal domain-containing protein [Desulfovibrio litoralis]|uniref:Flagellar basal-body rod protein FlgC n=1 Tax=Desulfovibrio litoralis DSM 11393 TaxID=1121455 RepID=A0A1M7RUR4_9BACT|nr:flagellar basal body rod C-terminal domain-containing protein [Desulfovibrio litoralis]SHN50003.1 flagellar basal-body rod protein FlgC [Desulfovibrio litoralis DSM 11393]
MNISNNTAASALNALSVDMLVRSNNIANINTQEFKASSVSFMDNPHSSGVSVGAITPSTVPGAFMPGTIVNITDRGESLQMGLVEASNTDLTREFSQMIMTQRAYEANTKTITATEEMSGTLINMIA